MEVGTPGLTEEPERTVSPKLEPDISADTATSPRQIASVQNVNDSDEDTNEPSNAASNEERKKGVLRPGGLSGLGAEKSIIPKKCIENLNRLRARWAL